MVDHGFTPEVAHAAVASVEAMGVLFYAMAFNREVKRKVRERQKNVCDCCGTEVCLLQVHHRRPESMGGSSTNIENAVGLCGEKDNGCHQEVDRETFEGREYPQVHTQERYFPQGNGLSGNIYPSKPRK